MKKLTLVFLLTFSTSTLMSLVSQSVQAATSDSGSKVKAAILFKITRFIHWSERQAKDKVLDLCILDDGALYSELKTTEGQRSKGYEIKVQQVNTAQKAYKGCELLFVGSRTAMNTPAIVKKLADNSILLVSDRQRFAKEGGMIQLKERNGRIRFTINLKSTRSSGLDISSQLLGLAKLIQ